MTVPTRGALASWAPLIIAVCLVLPGCAGKRSDHFAYDPPGFVQPDPLRGIPLAQEYRLGPADLVSVIVYGAPDISGDRRVDETGHITMPLIGAVSAHGKTTAELARGVAAELSRRYYEHPQVTVETKEAVGQRFTIDGSVSAPGVYPVVGSTTLLQAVAMAKGTDENANLRNVVIFRTINGQKMAAAFDLKAVREAQMRDPEVYAADIIIVDGNRTRQTLRDILMSIPIIGLFRPLYD